MCDIDRYDRFQIPGFLWLEKGSGGLSFLHVHNRHADCRIYPYGAHVASFKPQSYGELLWVSPYSSFEEGKPIRGGIPLCFPWFGRHPTRTDLPLHGFVRTRVWDPVSTAMLPDGRTRLSLSLDHDEAGLAVWPFPFRLELAVTVGETLELDLLIKNPGDEPFTFEEGFHTYFSVGDAEQCEIRGLDGVEYIDRGRGDVRTVQSGTLAFTGETVNAYMRVPEHCELADPLTGRRILVEQRRMNSTVVWNPGAAAADNPEIRETWNQFVCVESTNCLDCSLRVEPGTTHRSIVRLYAERL